MRMRKTRIRVSRLQADLTPLAVIAGIWHGSPGSLPLGSRRCVFACRTCLIGSLSIARQTKVGQNEPALAICTGKPGHVSVRKSSLPSSFDPLECPLATLPWESLERSIEMNCSCTCLFVFLRAARQGCWDEEHCPAIPSMMDLGLDKRAGQRSNSKPPG